jgi:hypothetical protein
MGTIANKSKLLKIPIFNVFLFILKIFHLSKFLKKKEGEEKYLFYAVVSSTSFFTYLRTFPLHCEKAIETKVRLQEMNKTRR